jgi:hypothetical protein
MLRWRIEIEWDDEREQPERHRRLGEVVGYALMALAALLADP